MDVKEAVSKAKAHVADIFSDEQPTNIGLEEVMFDDRAGAWKITIGFSRPWNTVKNALTALTGSVDTGRTLKVLTISNDDGRVLSIAARDAA
ncbi:MAG TPA: hypothetical protein VJ655_11945 [Caulobacter sp.]|nr:hypothetical protein [Caulobacter sp.]